MAASVVSTASNLAGKPAKKRRAPPPPSANAKGSAYGSQQSIDSISGNNNTGKLGSNVPNTLERFERKINKRSTLYLE